MQVLCVMNCLRFAHPAWAWPWRRGNAELPRQTRHAELPRQGAILGRLKSEILKSLSAYPCKRKRSSETNGYHLTYASNIERTYLANMEKKALDLPLCSENARQKNEDVIEHRHRTFQTNAKIALALPLCSENAGATKPKCSQNILRNWKC